MQLFFAWVLVLILGTWTVQALLRNFKRSRNPQTNPLTAAFTPIRPTLTETRFGQLERELAWARHRLAAAKPPRPFDAANYPCGLPQARPENATATLRDRQAQQEQKIAVWKQIHAKLEQARMRGPDTDEESAFDTAARSLAEIEADLAALPTTQVTVQDITGQDHDTSAPERSVVLWLGLRADGDSKFNYQLSAGLYRPGKSFDPSCQSADAIRPANHPCRASTVLLMEQEWYDHILRSGNNMTHFAWVISASHALYTEIVAQFLAALSDEKRALMDSGKFYTSDMQVLLTLPTQLPFGLHGRNLLQSKPDDRAKAKFGPEKLDNCTLHFQHHSNVNGPGDVFRSIRITELPQP